MDAYDGRLYHDCTIDEYKGTAAWPRGIWRAIASHFCLDGARDFLKIDEKIGLGKGQ